ncbi:S8 family serine peptidase [Piscicoccus intestinalis]|uniref:S8 family serine peptidase n=1 Tax=Piscicoccus intestinalis TaxID=746033 RepID=UPI000A01440D|nr:S8 family serine peptidase [Piscicoccus intestinalis]
MTPSLRRRVTASIVGIGVAVAALSAPAGAMSIDEAGDGPVLASAGLTGAAGGASHGSNAAADGAQTAAAGMMQAAPATAGLTAPTAPQAPATRSYVVNVGTGDAIAPARVRSVRAAITRAGGTVVQAWPQIGVFVVHSSRAGFDTRLRPSAATRITGVGPTRTVPVTEKLRTTRSTTVRAAQAPADATRTAAEPREREQWALRMVRASGRSGRPAAASVAPATLNGVTVAVIDSGIEADHPDLRGRIDTASSLDCTNAGRPDTTPSRWRNTTSGHGTHVAGIIAGARNGVGIAGVAPGVRVASVKVVNDDGFIYPEYAICGVLSAAAKGIRVANHSYFVDPWQFWCSTDKRQAAARESVRRAFAYAHRRGMLSVAAAGNEGVDLTKPGVDELSPGDSDPVSRRLDSTCLDLPTQLPGVVSVAAADSTGRLAEYSNFGRGVIDVMAPGTDVLSSYPTKTWARLSGTSMAAPHASGVAALLAARNPKAAPDQLAALLRRQARDMPCPRADRRCAGTTAANSFAGDGMVDASRAVGR